MPIENRRLVLLIMMIMTSLSSNANSQEGFWIWQHPRPQGNTLYTVSFVDSLTGWAVGEDGTIIHTSDGGYQWKIQSSGTSQALNDVCFINAKMGWAVGDKGTLLHTKDGGVNWERQNWGTSFNLYAICFVDTNNGWVTKGNGRMFHTSDRGKNWNSQSSGASSVFSDLFFIDQNQGWSDGTNIGFGTDYGVNWARFSDVIYHEYTHCVVHHIYGDWIGYDSNSEACAMNEAFPDYYACSKNGDPYQGDGITGVPDYPRDIGTNWVRPDDWVDYDPWQK